MSDERRDFLITSALLLGIEFVSIGGPKGWVSCILGNRVLYRAPTKGVAAGGALKALGIWI